MKSVSHAWILFALPTMAFVLLGGLQAVCMLAGTTPCPHCRTRLGRDVKRTHCPHCTHAVRQVL